MRIYLVGGAVRDTIMGIQPKDLDYVVVGSSPEEMLSLGYKQVGASFPVFLHPQSGDEYALARTEESTGEKYQDFDCYFGKDVTIEQDLERRDLTINATAKDLDTGEIIDPFGGVDDINNKQLRATSEAFKDDPLRLLRVLRFRARFGSEWTVDSETLHMLFGMEKDRLFNSLTPERVWKETEKALQGIKPSLYFNALVWWFTVFPELTALYETPQREDHHPEGSVGVHTMLVVDYAAETYKDTEITFACLMHDLGKPKAHELYQKAHSHEELGLEPIKSFCEKYKVPNSYRDLALLVCKHHTKVHGMFGRNNQSWTRPKSIMNLFQETNALAKPERFMKMLDACAADAKGRGLPHNETDAYEKSIPYFRDKPYKQREYLYECLEAVQKVDTKTISKEMLEKGKSGVMIGEAIRVARIDVIRKIQREWREYEKA